MIFSTTSLPLLVVAVVCLQLALSPVHGFAAFVQHHGPTLVFSKPLNMTRKAKQPPRDAWTEIDAMQQSYGDRYQRHYSVVLESEWLDVSLEDDTETDDLTLTAPLNAMHSTAKSSHLYNPLPAFAVNPPVVQTSTLSATFPPCIKPVHETRLGLDYSLEAVLVCSASLLADRTESSLSPTVSTWSFTRVSPVHQYSNTHGI